MSALLYRFIRKCDILFGQFSGYHSGSGGCNVCRLALYKGTTRLLVYLVCVTVVYEVVTNLMIIYINWKLNYLNIIGTVFINFFIVLAYLFTCKLAWVRFSYVVNASNYAWLQSLITVSKIYSFFKSVLLQAVLLNHVMLLRLVN